MFECRGLLRSLVANKDAPNILAKSQGSLPTLSATNSPRPDSGILRPDQLNKRGEVHCLGVRSDSHVGSSLNEGPFLGPFYKGAVPYWVPKKEP